MKLIKSDAGMKALGVSIGALLHGGEMIELVGDVGAGKTTLTKGIAAGLCVEEDVQSPSFTISREYPARDGLELHHYDFYRLSEPGVVKYELAESIVEPHVVTVVEWAETAEDVLPEDRIIIHLAYTEAEGRTCDAVIPEQFDYLKGPFA